MKYKTTIIGGIIGLILGLLPFLLVWDIIEIEILSILLVPLSLVSKNMLFIIFGTPILYAIIGALIGYEISLRKKK